MENTIAYKLPKFYTVKRKPKESFSMTKLNFWNINLIKSWKSYYDNLRSKICQEYILQLGKNASQRLPS